MRALSCIVLGAAALTGCDSSVEETNGGTGGGSSSATTSSASSASSMSSTSSAGGGGPHGDCTSDADCPGGKCVPVTPGGYPICATIPDEATMCSAPGSGDQCCTSADCVAAGGGACYGGDALQFCGGALGANQCVVDACATDADCAAVSPNAVCAPAGAFGLPGRACLAAFCHTDADCNAKAGGACLLIGENRCCTHPAPNGLGCVYPGDCTHDAECPDGACFLDPTTGEGACGPPGMGCPP